MVCSKWRNQLVSISCSALCRSIVIVAVLLMCLCGAYSIGLFNDARASSPEPVYLERNQIASALYASLATLPQPVTISDVARELNVFIQNESRVTGATLVDTKGQLLVQVGSGNEMLALGTHAADSGRLPTARIPVASEGRPFASAVLTFKTSSHADSPAWPLYTLAGIVTIMILVFAYIELSRYKPLGAPNPQ